MTGAGAPQPSIAAKLRAIRQVAEDRQQARLIEEIAADVRRYVFSLARIRHLCDMQISDVKEFRALLQQIPRSPADMLAAVPALAQVGHEVQVAEGTGITTLKNRLGVLADLVAKLRIGVTLREVQQVASAFTHQQLRPGDLRPQLGMLAETFAKLRRLHAEVEGAVFPRLHGLFGPKVDMEMAKKLMQDGVPVVALDPAALQRLMRSELAGALILRLK